MGKSDGGLRVWQVGWSIASILSQQRTQREHPFGNRQPGVWRRLLAGRSRLNRYSHRKRDSEKETKRARKKARKEVGATTERTCLPCHKQVLYILKLANTCLPNRSTGPSRKSLNDQYEPFGRTKVTATASTTQHSTVLRPQPTTSNVCKENTHDCYDCSCSYGRITFCESIASNGNNHQQCGSTLTRKSNPTEQKGSCSNGRSEQPPWV